MLFEDCAARCASAASEFSEHEHRDDGETLTHSLADGFDTLRIELFERAHEDVEATIGRDSMLLPVSPVKTELATNLEIELYMVAQSTDEVNKRNYVSDSSWFRNWLGGMRLGEAFQKASSQERLAEYLRLSPEERRLEFSDVLVQTFPEARHIPLVLYRLFPIAARIVTAIAFRDHDRADELRTRQLKLLPGIADCHQCRGKPLDNGDQCSNCGNPIWTYKWLTEAE
jgi:hypothetical protein